MLIVCPSCATSYTIDPETLGASGKTVRCARCKVTWFAEPEKNAELPEFANGMIGTTERHAMGETADDQSRLSAEAESFEHKEPSSIAPPEPEAPDDDFGAESPVPIGEIEARRDFDTDSEAAPAPLDSEEPDAVEDATGELPEAVADAPSLVPPVEHEPLPDEQDEASSDDIESYAARRQRLQAQRRRRRRSSRWIALAVVLFVFNAGVIASRETVVRHLPQTASFFSAIGLPVNLRHLSFEDVKISKKVQDGVNVLVVYGTIVSTGSKPVTVPRLRFAALDANGQETYTWSALPSRSILGPGERVEFRTRLASPPADARNVMVRFSNSSDAAPGSE